MVDKHLFACYCLSIRNSEQGSAAAEKVLIEYDRSWLFGWGR